MDTRLMRLAAILRVGAIAALLDTTIVSVAIRTIGRDLHAPLGVVQWPTAAAAPPGHAAHRPAAAPGAGFTALAVLPAAMLPRRAAAREQGRTSQAGPGAPGA